MNRNVVNSTNTLDIHIKLQIQANQEFAEDGGVVVDCWIIGSAPLWRQKYKKNG